MSISPFVYWAQSEDQISLKIDLKDVKVKTLIKTVVQIFNQYSTEYFSNRILI